MEWTLLLLCNQPFYANYVCLQAVVINKGILLFSGTVTMWAPNTKDPLVKMLCHRGPVQSIAIDTKGK